MLLLCYSSAALTMSKLWVMRGYSGSGKSTKAREIAEDNNAVVVCRDDLRKMLLGSYWTGKKQDEDRVTIAEKAQVESFLLAGTQVVVDATHLNPKYLRQWAKLATRMGVDFEVVDVHREVSVCRQNDHARMLAGGRYVGDKVIEDQAKRFPCRNWPTIIAEPFAIEPLGPWEQRGLPKAIICDIDGTLAHMTSRSPYDYTRVGEDKVDYIVSQMLEDYKMATEGTIIIVSGRDHTCIEETIAWLNDNHIHYDDLFMRDADRVDDRGNKIPDYMVKYELFNKYIRGKYNVLYVLDDRKQVVDMWRKLGLKCLQVAEGNF